MLLILIPTAWLTVIGFFVILCRAAAGGDATLPAASHGGRRVAISGLTVWEDPPVRGYRASRPLRVAWESGRRTSSCDVRGHSARHVAGS